jgi:hypothetical protein
VEAVSDGLPTFYYYDPIPATEERWPKPEELAGAKVYDADGNLVGVLGEPQYYDDQDDMAAFRIQPPESGLGR